MDDKTMNDLLKSIQKDVEPPEGLKDKMLKNILIYSREDTPVPLSPFEKFIFGNPLGAACILSSAISAVLWAVMGRGYSNILTSFIGKR